MKISILTIAPECFGDFLHSGVTGRAIQNGLAQIDIVDIREFVRGSFRAVDDSPFGGGPGLVLRAKPVLDALDHVVGDSPALRVRTVLLSPSGTAHTQKRAHEFAEQYEHLVLVCGHYEGIDARVLPFVDEQLSIGDYVLTGGELAAQVVADSVIRLLPGALREGSAGEESFENGLLEYPQYTRPARLVLHGQEYQVPEVLLSGDHEKIRSWRRQESLRITGERRPELLDSRDDGAPDVLPRQPEF